MPRPRRLRVGIAGLGAAGRAHLAAWRKVPRAEVVALADPEIRRIARSGIDRAHLDGVALHDDPLEMLDAPGVDSVDVCAPTYLHSRLATRALRRGKHVVCEAPAATTVVDAEKMLSAARSNKRLFMVGHVLRFRPEYAWARKALGSRRFGRPLAASFRRIAPEPASGWKEWHLDESRSGGAALDLHVHDVDIVRWFFGPPAAVTSRAAGVAHIRTVYEYRKGPAVSAEAGWASAGRFPAEDSFLVACERGAIDYRSGRDPALVYYTGSGRERSPRLAARDPYAEELAYFASALGSGRRPERMPPEDAREAVRIAWAEVHSAQTGGREAL